MRPHARPPRGFDQFRYACRVCLNCAQTVWWCWPGLILYPDRTQAGQRRRYAIRMFQTGKAMRRAVDILGIDQSFRACAPAGARSLKEYRAMLQHSTAHVYSAAPHVFSTGLLEASLRPTGRGAPDTPPVREVVQDGVNGFLCDFWDHENIVRKNWPMCWLGLRSWGMCGVMRGRMCCACMMRMCRRADSWIRSAQA